MPDPLDPTTLDLGSDPELGPLLSAHPDIEPLRFRDGERLVVEGEDSQDLYILLRGALVVEKVLPDGTQRPLAQLECRPQAPVIIGEMAYFGAQRRTATVRAVGSCQALHLKPSHLDAIMAGFPGLTRILCRQFTARLSEANQELRDLRARFDLAAHPRMAQPGEVLLETGEPAHALFQLTMGSVRVDEGMTSRVVRAEDLPEGFLGLEAFLRGIPHPFTATVEEPCFLAVIEAERREAFLRSYPGLVIRLLQS
ncbi:Crp/Fnr family transcriptional regulator [Geothrix sp. PMB-07]|uniref:Crp/Fnr family transcriptional regulator n=1 Tax=Geothrix sp. PMB-07 TaxID=3068640 RepID=UPI002740C37B|nr:cyclic nucleotide-binding domain-containing protein [Geothrix sp. PMB-07]WLT29962.1 cyclic nucleotide-binding domain-containing protein [Geothrix sp. PMB-07]